MSIHEQITALLDGELVDAGSVGELLHVLAVSPEKRDLLVEQLALKRRYAASAASIVPPPAADLAIMRGLAAVDAGFAAAGPAAADVAPAPIPFGSVVTLPRAILLATSALVVLLGAFGAGYLLRGERVESAGPSATTSTVTSADASALAAARDSIALLSRQLGSVTAEGTVAQSDRLAMQGADGSVRGGGDDAPDNAGYSRDNAGYAPDNAGSTRDAARSMRDAARSVRNGTDGPLAARSSTSREASDATIPSANGPTSLGITRDERDGRDDRNGIAVAERSDYLIPSHPRAHGSDELSLAGGGVSRPGRPQATAGASILDETASAPIGLQLGIRNNFRLSLPRVYGLTKAPTALQDRELVGSIALGGEEDGLFSRLRAGAAFGQTQFSIVVHSNTGGAAIDTVYEMSPQPFYARGFLAPEILRVDRFAGLVELGGGYSGAGGFGTVGLNLEYRPIEEVAIHGGASTWLLWSSFRGAVELSTNVNVHFGFMYGF